VDTDAFDDKSETIVPAGHGINGGDVQIADDVVGVIAGIAASEVEGVAALASGFVGGITEMLGRKNPSRGISVEIGEKEVSINISLIVNYGVRIPDVAARVQENVKSAVESMTGLRVTDVNVHVQGVSFHNEDKREEAGVR